MSPLARQQLTQIANTFAAKGFNPRIRYPRGEHFEELIRAGMLWFQGEGYVLTDAGIAWANENHERA